MNQDADTARSVGDFFVSAIGSGLVFFLLFPTGCKAQSPPAFGASAPLVCPDGSQTDLLGWSVFGLVGTVDQTGAAVIALIIAGLCYLIAGALRS